MTEIIGQEWQPIIEISILFFAIFRGWHFEYDLVVVKYGQIFIAKIIISQ